ncbi:hypothetical protein H6G80_15290 [Nostoc sp. FACHB-87]|uniref:DUF6519 domain-containing protein n=1 Tax=Nostocaceae TaxID=1162 RepID=UPI001683AB21|nr:MULTISPECIES: DUF6519 domain-containing protein [Nostocaceae]MBD2455443.1 hypothetical protein [Nostoc sp. FACHB-87]MBD2475843.1 hypothetical protein [Anabaena sp. FACHB-83]
MKGDFSRFTFNPQKRFSRVLMQQGRVQLDADWNEQLDITEHRIAAEITDFIGQSGAPEKYAGFEITAINEPKNLKIGAGRYYVEGMLFENDQPVLFTAQSDYPSAELPKEEGIYFAYLDVWQRHVTALEDPEIREPALGGADTATRVKNVWQVKLQKVGNNADKSFFAPPDWKPSWEKPLGKLSAILGAGANLENQLYRVEIHTGGTLSQATFKWSRDNGSIATHVEKIVGQEITVSRLGQDIQTAFAAGNWVEITTEKQTLSGEPGLLVELASVTANTLTVKEWTDRTAPDYDPSMIVRRWDSGEISVSDSWRTLESEIKVRFENQLQDRSFAEYKTGDYWLIPTRNLTANNEWSSNKPQSPHGILHRYCSLALVEYRGGQFTVKDDCRVIFKPLTTGLLSKGGDTMTGSLTIDKDLYVTGKVGIGTKNVGGARLTVETPNDYDGSTIQFEAKKEPNLYNLSLNTSVTDSNVRWVFNQTNNSQLYNSVLVFNKGNVGISTTNPQSKLAVSGGVAIGSKNYVETTVAPNNSLLVETYIGIGKMGNWSLQTASYTSVKGGIVPIKGIIIDGASNLYICTVLGSSFYNGVLDLLLPRPKRWAVSVLPAWSLDITNIARNPRASIIGGATGIEVVEYGRGEDFPSEANWIDGDLDYISGYRYWQLKTNTQPKGIIIVIISSI